MSIRTIICGSSVLPITLRENFPMNRSDCGAEHIDFVNAGIFYLSSSKNFGARNELLPHTRILPILRHSKSVPHRNHRIVAPGVVALINGKNAAATFEKQG